MTNEALREACEKAGGQQPLADKIGTSQSQIWFWLNEAKKGVAPEFVIPIEQATGVPRWRLRPDIYPPPKRRVSSPEPVRAAS